MRRFRYLVGITSVLYFMFSTDDSVAEVYKSAKPRVDIDYREILASCGKTLGRYGVGFIKFSKGLWPVPSTMTVLDSTQGYLEYGDLAYPWQRVLKPSKIYLTDPVSLGKYWDWLIAQKPVARDARCGLAVTHYQSVNEFGYPASIITDQKEYLILIGPISSSVDVALNCYLETVPIVGASCS